MRKSIKTRLVINFMLIIIITILILEIVLMNVVREYYYKNVESLLRNQIQLSLEYFSRYYSASRLEDIIIDDIDVFWKHTSSQVQILDENGNLLMDSLGVVDQDNISSDIKNAINGNMSRWMGKVSYSNSMVMALSAPIKNEDKIIGVIRFVTSLDETNGVIRSVTSLLLFMGLIVVLISGSVSLFLANTIVKPLEEVTNTAERMADGQLKIRSNVRLKDEIGKLSDTLNYMAEELVRKEDIKNDFISSVSHELRTPLTSIKGWAITLKSEDFGDNELILDGLEIIEKESDRLTTMVEDLLDFSRFVSGRIKLEKDEFNIKETLEMISKQLTPRANNNKIELDLVISETINTFMGDENRIKQVLINLLDNAFKFTDPGGRVILKAEELGPDLIIEVIDNGIGIPREELLLVKEKFYKGKNSKSHSGIGLSICDEIIRLHQGSMEILSKVSEGTRVIVKLPLKGERI